MMRDIAHLLSRHLCLCISSVQYASQPFSGLNELARQLLLMLLVAEVEELSNRVD
jgi:hypothetical protein